jgi:uncharacterized Zn-finger protein
MKKLQCDLCDKTFAQAGDLKKKKHKRIHTGEKPYVCNRSFPQSDNLEIHNLVQTGEKPHNCDICDKSFSLG